VFSKGEGNGAGVGVWDEVSKVDSNRGWDSWGRRRTRQIGEKSRVAINGKRRNIRLKARLKKGDDKKKGKKH